MPAPAASTAAPGWGSRSAASSRTCSAARSSCAARRGGQHLHAVPAAHLPGQRVGRLPPASRDGAAAAPPRLRAPAPSGRRSRSDDRGAIAARRQRAAHRRGRSALFARIMVGRAKDKGFKVLVAMRGAEALALAREHQPTAISLDIFLPDMLGWTVLSQLKQDPATRHIPVQIVTLDEDRHHGLARGAFSFVHKPDHDRGLERRSRASRTMPSPRRKRLLLVEDDEGRAQQRRRAAWPRRHRDRAADTGARRSSSCARSGRLRRARPEAAGHVRLRGARERFATMRTLRDVPVVVFTGPRAVRRGGCEAAHHGAQRRGQGRRIAGAAAR
jgi:CheY-like chemotaxis protein